MVARLGITITRHETAAPIAPQTLPYRVTRSIGSDDWTIRDPSGGAICRAASYERAVEVAQSLTECARRRPPKGGLAC
jgi:hypothetical protein